MQNLREEVLKYASLLAAIAVVFVCVKRVAKLDCYCCCCCCCGFSIIIIIIIISCRPFGPAFYGGLMVPFLIIYIFNWIIFVSIFVSLLRKKALTNEVGVATKLRQNFIIALTLSLLFGLGWGVGLVATSQISIPGLSYTLQTVFVLLTAFQGLLIFIMHCVRSEESRKQWKKWIYVLSLHKICLHMKTSTLTGQITSDYGKGTSGKNNHYVTLSSAAQTQTLQRVLKKEVKSNTVSDSSIDHKSAFGPSPNPLEGETKVDLSSDKVLQDKTRASNTGGNTDDSKIVINQNALKDYKDGMEMDEKNCKQDRLNGGEEMESIISEFGTVWLPNSTQTSCTSLQGLTNEKRLSRQSGVADLVPTRTSHTQLPGGTRTSHSQLPGGTRQNNSSSVEKSPLIEEQESSEGDNSSLSHE